MESARFVIENRAAIFRIPFAGLTFKSPISAYLQESETLASSFAILQLIIARLLENTERSVPGTAPGEITQGAGILTTLPTIGAPLERTGVR